MDAEIISLSDVRAERRRQKVVAFLNRRGGNLNPSADWHTIGLTNEYLWGKGSLSASDHWEICGYVAQNS